jgi:Ca-activated chloride channel family protein
MRRSSAAVAASWAAAAAFVCAAQVGVQPGPVFKAAAELVVLHVNVFDGRSDAVPNLPQDAFLVFEDDKVQEITFFTGADVPVAVGLVVDNSSSMLTRRPMVLAGARAFVESSHPEDELFTIVFNEHVRFGLPEGVSFTRSREQVAAGLNRFPAGGKTALYDAVIAGLDHLGTAPHQKRVLIVLSDGGDNASRHSKEDMLARAVASDALIYTVTRQGGDTPQRGDEGLMRRLAEVSGGVAYFPDGPDETIAHFTEIAGNIRRGYSIGYVPPSAGDGRYHRVRIMVRVPGRNNLTARARDGYASRPAATR